MLRISFYLRHSPFGGFRVAVNLLPGADTARKTARNKRACSRYVTGFVTGTTKLNPGGHLRPSRTAPRLKRSHQGLLAGMRKLGSPNSINFIP